MQAKQPSECCSSTHEGTLVTSLLDGGGWPVLPFCNPDTLSPKKELGVVTGLEDGWIEQQRRSKKSLGLMGNRKYLLVNQARERSHGMIELSWL